MAAMLESTANECLLGSEYIVLLAMVVIGLVLVLKKILL